MVFFYNVTRIAHKKKSKTSHVRTYSLQNTRDIKQNQKLGTPVNVSVHQPEPSIHSPASKVQSLKSRVQRPESRVQQISQKIILYNTSRWLLLY